MTTKWEVVTRVQNRIKDIPSDLGSAVIVQYVEDGASLIQEYTGLSITLTDIGSKFVPALTAFGAATVLGYMEGVGISYNLGTMKVDKRTELDGVSKQLEHEVNMFNMSNNALGRRIKVSKTEPTT